MIFFKKKKRIEELETNLEKSGLAVVVLTEQNNQLEYENIQLRAEFRTIKDQYEYQINQLENEIHELKK